MNLGSNFFIKIFKFSKIIKFAQRIFPLGQVVKLHIKHVEFCGYIWHTRLRKFSNTQNFK